MIKNLKSPILKCIGIYRNSLIDYQQCHEFAVNQKLNFYALYIISFFNLCDLFFLNYNIPYKN